MHRLARASNDGPIYFAMAWYNLELLLTYALFIVWNMVPGGDEQRRDENISFLVPVLAQTVNMLLSIVMFLVVQYYGRWTWRELQFSLRFYVVNILACSFVIYAWLILAIILRFNKHHTACVTIVTLSFEWFLLLLYLYDCGRAYWRDSGHQTIEIQTGASL